MPKANKKFITVSWKAGREPVDNMFWCEAELDGTWTNITTIDRLRSRREVVERIAELDQAIIGFDFAFSFPQPFLESLKPKNAGWVALSKRIREDLKKNTDDGVRAWIEHMGKYRESQLEQVEDANHLRFTPHGRDNRRNFQPEPLQPYERRSLAERFRRIDMILKRKDPEGIASVLGIRYNKLTTRYEFTDSESRGRAALLGIAMLEQLVEAKPDIAIWPFMKPAALTVVEIFPKMFANKVANNADALKKFLETEEDNALYVSREVRDLVFANPQAHDIFFALLGIIKAERREDKTLRPLRDYRDSFYDNEEIKAEGWSYGIGFKEPERKTREAAVPPTQMIAEAVIMKEKLEKEAPVEAPAES